MFRQIALIALVGGLLVLAACGVATEPASPNTIVTETDESGHDDLGHQPPVVPDDAVTEMVDGVVIDVVGDLSTTEAFTLALSDGSQIIFYPTADATFHGGPMSHIRDHLLTGEHVRVEYVQLPDGSHAATYASDH
jgi:hypothetical protein